MFASRMLRRVGARTLSSLYGLHVGTPIVCHAKFRMPARELGPSFESRNAPLIGNRVPWVSSLRYFSQIPASSSEKAGGEEEGRSSSGHTLVEIDKKNFFRAMTGFCVVQLAWWGSVGVFGVLDWYWLGESAERMAVSPMITGLGSLSTVLCVGLTKVYAGKNVGSIVVHPSGRSCSVFTYTMFGRLKEKFVQREDIIDHASSTNYYTFKLRGDQMFTLIDRKQAVFESDDERRLLHFLKGNPIVGGGGRHNTADRPISGSKPVKKTGISGELSKEKVLVVAASTSKRGRDHQSAANNEGRREMGILKKVPLKSRQGKTAARKNTKRKWKK
jgi:hypothetical protein